MSATTIDPYANVDGRGGFLSALNPLAKLAAPMPAMVLLVFVRDLATPLAFLALAAIVLVIGVRWSARLALLLGLALPAAVCVIGVGMSLWVDPELVATTPVVLSVGPWQLRSGALEIGFATGLRLASILALALIAGLATSGPDLIRSLVQHLRVPYRIGYTALAAFRFVPRFGYELELIRQAHRVRGAHLGRGPFQAIARWWGYIVPLMAGAIRHAERVALAMDSRAFGAHRDRTERHVVPFRARDWVFIGVGWLLSAVVLWCFFPWTLN